jgi:hypothetical protein
LSKAGPGRRLTPHPDARNQNVDHALGGPLTIGSQAYVRNTGVMAIVALQAPDFRTISEFRRRHLAALSALFVQVLKLCERAGLVKRPQTQSGSSAISSSWSRVVAASKGTERRIRQNG